MKTVYAVALAATLALSGGALLIAAEQPAGTPASDGSQAAPAGTAESLPPKDQSRPESDGPPAKEGSASSTIDVHRHRPGACPEGPPCKVGD